MKKAAAFLTAILMLTLVLASSALALDGTTYESEVLAPILLVTSPEEWTESAENRATLAVMALIEYIGLTGNDVNWTPDNPSYVSRDGSTIYFAYQTGDGGWLFIIYNRDADPLHCGVLILAPGDADFSPDGWTKNDKGTLWAVVAVIGIAYLATT